MTAVEQVERTTRELFGACDLRCTKQRMAVYDALREAMMTHPTAEELFRQVKPRMESLSLATIYNSLDALVGAGLVRKLPTGNGSFRYDADVSLHAHVCFDDTSEIVDVPKALGERLVEHLPGELLRKIEEKFDVRVNGVSLQIHARRSGDGGWS